MSALFILKRVLDAFSRETGQYSVPKPCDCFDMIGGSSVGGYVPLCTFQYVQAFDLGAQMLTMPNSRLVAILLGIYELSVDQAIKVFIDTLPRIFNKAKKFTTFRAITGGTRYSSTYLAEVLASVEKRLGYGSSAIHFPRNVSREGKCITYVNPRLM